MKRKIISISTVVILLIAVIIAVKLGKVKIFNNSKDSSFNNESVLATQQKDTIYSTDKMIMLNIGGEGVYERTGKVGNVSYRFRYIDYNISKKKPEEIDIDFYKQGEEQIDSNQDFIDDTYYITVKYTVTNMIDSGEENNFAPQTFVLGVYDDNGFVAKCEPRGHYFENVTDVRGSIHLGENETATVTTCYCVKKDILENKNIAVQASVLKEKKAIKMPYFLINVDGVIE